MRLYIAGPMTGLPGYNYPAFNLAERRLRDAGYDVLNPTLGRDNPSEDPPDMTWVDYLRAALRMVADADGIALLPNWEVSRGARLEFHVATSLDMLARPLDYWLSAGDRSAAL